MQVAKAIEPPNSAQPSPPSEASLDQQFFIGVGMIVSTRNCDREKLYAAIRAAGGKICFRTVTPAPLYVLRHYEVEQILSGDSSALAELQKIHDRKSKERREMKKIE